VFGNDMRSYGEELSAPRPTPQVTGPPLVASPRLFSQYICNYPPYWRPFLHLEPGDMDPLVAVTVCTPDHIFLMVIRSRRMRWAGLVARMGERRGVCRVWVVKPEGKRPL